MTELKQQNFKLPVKLIELMDNDPRSKQEIVSHALHREFGLTEKKKPNPIAKVAQEDFEARVNQLRKTLSKRAAERVAALEMQ